jgi:hypothetical protein
MDVNRKGRTLFPVFDGAVFARAYGFDFQERAREADDAEDGG